MSIAAKLAYGGLAAAFLAGSVMVGSAVAQRRGKRKPAVGVHVVTLPTQATGEEGKQVDVLLETPRVKIATITLRKGTALPAHSAPVPITIQALSGSGTLRANDRGYALASGTLLALAPDQEHEVVPKDKGDLVLLVHYMKARRGRRGGR